MHPPHTKQRAHRPSGSFSFGVVRYFVRVPGLGLVELDRLDLARRRQRGRVAWRAAVGSDGLARGCIAHRGRYGCTALLGHVGLLVVPRRHADEACHGVRELIPCTAGICDVARELKVQGWVVCR